MTCSFRLFLLALFVEAKTMGLGAMRVLNWRLVLLVAPSTGAPQAGHDVEQTWLIEEARAGMSFLMVA